MASTGWKHGFESLKEVRLLVALDFLKVSEVLSQPFRLDFEHAGGHAWHIPDFLAVFGGGMWLLDVRPMELIKEEDALKFAAAREVAAACGWRYSVVAGWRPHVWSVLDHMSSRRRPARDLLGMRDQLLTAISGQQGQAMTFVPRYSSGRWSHRASTSSLHARSKPRSLRKSSNNGRTAEHHLVPALPPRSTRPLRGPARRSRQVRAATRPGHRLRRGPHSHPRGQGRRIAQFSDTDAQ
jgi:hypothetical protein